jgi:putative endonuclease
MTSRARELQQALVGSFPQSYNFHRRVDCESFARFRDAVHRARDLKNLNRAWKVQLIESVNHGWNDLSDKPTQLA